jgi:hypothetical protein
MKTVQGCVVAAMAAVDAVCVGMAAEEPSPGGKGAAAAVRTATVVVAAADAAAQLRTAADVVCPGKDDHLVINAAIAALPENGGRVHLTGGLYSIGAIEGTFGGITIARSNVLLTGEGSGTRLLLQGGLTDINVIWIQGDIHDVVVRDLYIDGNGKAQVPWVRARAAWQGGNGIKIIDPAAVIGPTPRNVKVMNCHIENCQLMAVMAHGMAVEVLDCYFSGSFGSHVIEILGHSGRIEGCTLRVKDGDTVAFGFSTDASYNYHIINNKIIVEPGGTITSHPINNWPPKLYGQGKAEGQEYHGVIAGNILNNQGTTGYVRLDGYMDLVHHNTFRGVSVVIGCPNGGMGVTFDHNLLINSSLEIKSPHRDPESRILIDGNQFFNSPVKHTDGIVVWGSNPGYVTGNAGTAVIPADQTAVTVEHGLVAVPASVQLTPANSLGAATKFWMDGLTPRQFTIHVDARPGEPTAVFHWQVSTTGAQTLGSTP